MPPTDVSGENPSRRRFLRAVPLAALAGCTSRTAKASTPPSQDGAIVVRRVEGAFDDTVDAVRAALKEAGFGILFEADIGTNLERYASKAGEPSTGMTGIRALVFCSPSSALQVAREQPDALALCPLRVTIAHDGTASSVLFVRPTAVAPGPSIAAVESRVLAAIDAAAGA